MVIRCRAIENAREHLEGKIDELREKHGVPALSGVLVRDGGDTVVARSRGVRKFDVGHSVSANQVDLFDRFNLGSTTKPFTGYLIAYLVQLDMLGWKTALADVFPELGSLAFRTRYGVQSDYLGKTVEQLMTHNAGMGYGPVNGQEMIYDNLAGEFTDESSTMESEKLRRYNFLITSLQDIPIAGPMYGGGIRSSAEQSPSAAPGRATRH